MRKFIPGNYMGQGWGESQKQGHAYAMNKAQAGDAGSQVVELQRREFEDSHISHQGINQFACSSHELSFHQRKANRMMSTTSIRRSTALGAA
jgi:hypothetical protein